MRRLSIPVRLLVTCVLLVLPRLAAEACAQPTYPIGPFVADLRVAIPRFKDDVSIATAVGVGTIDLPTRGLGLAGGAHWYPVRGRVALGVGAELLVAGASRTREADEEDPTSVEGPTVNARLRSFSPQLSLNFGTGRGWSYLTGGLGWGGFTTEREDRPLADPASAPRILNYGGGARWFAKEHLAFTVDLRFYSVAAQEATIGRPAYPSLRLMVFSAGVSFK